MSFTNNNNYSNFFKLKWICTILFVIYCQHVRAQIDENNPLYLEIIRRSKGADIKAWMNVRVNPCENFYQFACGNWGRINKAETLQYYNTDVFQKISRGMQRYTFKLLNDSNTADAFVNKTRDFHKSCQRVSSNREYYKQSLHTLYREYGNFSFVKASPARETHAFNWWSTIADIQKTYGKGIIILLDVQGDITDKNQNRLYISPPEFTMFSPGEFGRILKYLMNLFDLSEAEATAVYDDMAEFESDLAQGATDVEEGKTVEELLTLYNTTDFVENYKDLFDMEYFLRLALNTTQLPEQIYVFDENYMQNLIEVMNSTQPHIVENYILWKYLEEFLIDTASKEPEEICGRKTKKFFGKFMEHTIYHKEIRATYYEQAVYEMWHGLKETFAEMLQSDLYHWMSAEVREEAIRKLHNMNLTINSYDDEDFPKFFQGLSIDRHDYVRNIQNMLRHSESLRTDKMQPKPLSNEDVEVVSFTPIYQNAENSIIMPVSFLQYARTWHRIYPHAIKYATLGFLLSHEMIHGFDDEGRQYDAEGQVRDWWDEESDIEFEKKRQCFQNQYQSYIYDGAPLPSGMAQAENIADNAGVKLAFESYKRWWHKANSHRNEPFPNLPYDNWKLFFLSFAQLWCEDVHPDYMTMLATQDTHAPSMFRIIGSLSNFDQFSEVFRCKSGSPMNPIKKCGIY